VAAWDVGVGEVQHEVEKKEKLQKPRSKGRAENISI
jgi:hypothetical protein